jgi:hypothetical protein
MYPTNQTEETHNSYLHIDTDSRGQRSIQNLYNYVKDDTFNITKKHFRDEGTFLITNGVSSRHFKEQINCQM